MDFNVNVIKLNL